MSSTVITSGIGYLYWVVAAHLYSAHDLGLGSTFLSIMTLTSTFANVGIGSALIQILPQRKAGHEWSLALNVSIVMSILASLLGGLIITIVLPLLSPQFSMIKVYTSYGLIIIVSVAIWTVATLLDQIFVAERATGNMAIRNTVFALLKLLLMIPLIQMGALGVFSSWVLAAAATVLLAGLVLIPRLKRDYRFVIRGMKKQVRSMLSLFAGNHFISIGSMLPEYLLPVFVSIRLSVTDNAYFYTTWMMGSIFFMVSPSVAASLLSEGSHTAKDVAQKARTSLIIISVLLGPIMLVCLLGGRYIMSFFGPSYPEHGLSLLIILAVSAVPDAITNVYVSLLRVWGRLRFAAFLNLTMAAITLGLGWILLPILGIAGAGWAWLIAQSTGSLIVGVDILISRGHEAWSNKKSTQGLSLLKQLNGSANIIEEAVWLMETTPLPAISQNYSGTEAISLIDTLLLPAMKLTAKRQFITIGGKSKFTSQNKNGTIKGDSHHYTPEQNDHSRMRRPSRKLKPIQLRSYPPHPGHMPSRIPVTDPGVEGQFLEKMHDDSPIFEDKIR
jgi:O-antigen/teichoic acid export membrane protein